MKNGKRRNIKIEFDGGRYLSADEADAIRAEVAAMKPKTHLVLSNWRWLECRGLAEAKAAQLIETLRALGLRFRELKG